MSSIETEEKRKRLNYGSLLLGIGLAGAFDGVVFHQLLQWHSVYMHTHRHGQIVSDGLFHAATVVALVFGAVLLWRAGHPGGVERGRRLLFGGALVGAGGFNVVEGLVNHHLLQVHHVRPGHPQELLYDLAFLASGVLLYAIGYAIRQHADGRGRKRAVGA
ncbi:DUF2243 domain-containing protein [Paenibacillus sp.]|uniref:DUF2243 domain-containing protein n=1 Tax=Paenibacillus sp. TaxID=58172 RepID=UPI002D4D567C|nr:DUF2243 domain-containing protein [Paenibacillus sp.]HZG54999.1 DUF2243 domain-containing protein [Paenibacillus sp.]